MRTSSFLLGVSIILPLSVGGASCSGAASTVGDGGLEGTAGDVMPSDSPPPGDVGPGYDVSSDTTVDTGSDSTSDVTATESGGDAPGDGASDSGFDVASFDASDGGGADVVFLEAGFDAGGLDATALCPGSQPTSGTVCFNLGITCDYGPLPKGGAICTCQVSTHKWHCLFV